MKLNYKNQVNLVLVNILLTFLVLGCDAWVNLDGKVLDESGNPVRNAQIVIKQGKSKVAEVMSKENGSFRINENICPMPGCSSTIKLTVIKEGFQTYEKVLSQEETDRREVKVVLKKN